MREDWHLLPIQGLSYQCVSISKHLQDYDLSIKDKSLLQDDLVAIMLVIKSLVKDYYDLSRSEKFFSAIGQFESRLLSMNKNIFKQSVIADFFKIIQYLSLEPALFIFYLCLEILPTNELEQLSKRSFASFAKNDSFFNEDKFTEIIQGVATFLPAELGASLQVLLQKKNDSLVFPDYCKIFHLFHQAVESMIFEQKFQRAIDALLCYSKLLMKKKLAIKRNITNSKYSGFQQALRDDADKSKQCQFHENNQSHEDTPWFWHLLPVSTSNILTTISHHELSRVRDFETLIPVEAVWQNLFARSKQWLCYFQYYYGEQVKVAADEALVILNKRIATTKKTQDCCCLVEDFWLVLLRYLSLMGVEKSLLQQGVLLAADFMAQLNCATWPQQGLHDFQETTT